jgi:urease accessory protein
MAASASEVPSLQRGDGALDIAFARRGTATAVARLYQRTPCRVQFPHAEGGDAMLAMLLNTAGGLTGGDRVAMAIAVEAAAAVTLTSAAAEKIYRSSGADCVVEIALECGADAWLEWLPQETILFEGARLRRKIVARVAAAGRLLAAEMLVFGRIARGERLAHGLLHECWRVERDGGLVWFDTTRLDGEIAALIDRPAGFGGAEAFATAIYVGADAEYHLALARERLDGLSCCAGATLVNGLLLARFIGTATAVRAGLANYLGAMRHAAAGLPAKPPRAWQI